jgi:hypothetical protein
MRRPTAPLLWALLRLATLRPALAPVAPRLDAAFRAGAAVFRRAALGALLGVRFEEPDALGRARGAGFERDALAEARLRDEALGVPRVLVLESGPPDEPRSLCLLRAVGVLAIPHPSRVANVRV